MTGLRLCAPNAHFMEQFLNGNRVEKNTPLPLVRVCDLWTLVVVGVGSMPQSLFFEKRRDSLAVVIVQL